jgi:hypothetical protein
MCITNSVCFEVNFLGAVGVRRVGFKLPYKRGHV